MKLDFESCLKSGKIKRVKPDINLARLELKEAKADLKSAEKELKVRNWKWAVEKAYYSMFHAARALLLLKGLKERSHICLLIALKELYVKTGILPRKYLEYIEVAKFRREDAIYASKYSKEIATTHIQNAKEFLIITEQLLSMSEKK